jgi:ABC-type transport system substrate-binding protein
LTGAANARREAARAIPDACERRYRPQRRSHLGEAMRHTSRPRRGGAVAKSLVAVIALCVAALVATSGTTGADVVAQKQQKIDKNAVLRFALALADQGGVGFDPANMRPSPANNQFADGIYDVMIHDTPDRKGAPGLATKWSAVDASTAELTLRQGVKFTDGTPFNAAAVKQAWDRAIAADQTIDPPSVRAMTSVDAVNENTVRVHFNQPVAQAFLDADVHHSAILGVPSPTAAAGGNLNSKPVGAGPYVLDSFVQDQKVVLKRNPDYWNPKAQLLAGIEYTQAGTGAPAVGALQAGSADLIWGIPADAVNTLANTPGIELTNIPGTRVLDIGLCATKGVFANKDARLAMQYAIDRDAINEGAYSGNATPWQTVMGPTSPYYDKKLNQTYSHNVKKAKQLLAKAGVAPGTVIKGLANSAAPQPILAEIVQDQLKDVGLDLQYTVTTNLVEDAPRVQPDVLFVALDPQLMSLAFSGDPTVLNVCGYSNPEIKTDMLAINDPTKTDADKAKAAADFQRLVLDESPVVVTILSPVTAAHTEKVHGIETITVPYGPNLNTVYMTK